MAGRKQRLDVLMRERGLTRSRERAQRLILAGEVLVDGQVALKAGHRVDREAEITIRERPPYVSRGGKKLAAALEAFSLDVENSVAVDVGASTGGFTDCLLQHGARRVYAVDVGYGQLAWKLRQDERVIVIDRTNARYLERLPEPVDVATIDVSFISLRLILPRVQDWLKAGGNVVALVKPQFEAGRDQVGKGGIVRDVAVHREVLCRILGYAQAEGWSPRGLIRSPITGQEGNVEFLLWLGMDGDRPGIVAEEAVTRVLEEHG